MTLNRNRWTGYLHPARTVADADTTLSPAAATAQREGSQAASSGPADRAPGPSTSKKKKPQRFLADTFRPSTFRIGDWAHFNVLGEHVSMEAAPIDAALDASSSSLDAPTVAAPTPWTQRAGYKTAGARSEACLTATFSQICRLTAVFI